MRRGVQYFMKTRRRPSVSLRWTNSSLKDTTILGVSCSSPGFLPSSRITCASLCKHSSLCISSKTLLPAEMSERQITYKGPDLQNSQKKRFKNRGSLWRLMTGILGIFCLVLVVTVGILVSRYYPNPVQQASVATPERGLHHCSCPENWVWFRHSCYRFFSHHKTWREGRSSCEAQNSSLLILKSKEELEFFTLESFHWIGLSQEEETGSWIWEDGSNLSSKLLSFPMDEKDRRCVIYKSQHSVLSERCTYKTPYICKLKYF
ncbi:natural killer cells antigen CD94-like [Tachyglossus aculeatus]|uniref:natural killer cells antigen CD94-like n=1 Tax=Tachyglossus aculeatus TaxID=9261 RepID=UPI0018F40410|nr:natural killer cells antigen CD94-like [Tachyglossus aculeatus]